MQWSRETCLSKNVHQTWEIFLTRCTLAIEHKNEQMLFKNLARFDFEKIFAQTESFKGTEKNRKGWEIYSQLICQFVIPDRTATTFLSKPWRSSRRWNFNGGSKSFSILSKLTKKEIFPRFWDNLTNWARKNLGNTFSVPYPRRANNWQEVKMHAFIRTMNIAALPINSSKGSQIDWLICKNKWNLTIL